MSLIHIHPLWWVAILVGAFLLLLLIVSIVEKRITRPFEPIDGRSSDQSLPPGQRDERPTLPYAPPDVASTYALALPQMPAYTAEMARQVAAVGFVFGCEVQHVKRPQILIRGTVWLSPERDILVLSGSGTVLRMATRQTWLYTPLRDHRLLVTTDQNDEGDISGMFLVRRRLNADFRELLDYHRRRITDSPNPATTFAEVEALSALEALQRRRVQVLVDRGLACYRDDGQATWRYTLLGGLRICLGFFVQLGGALTQFWRVNRKQVGS